MYIYIFYIKLDDYDFDDSPINFPNGIPSQSTIAAAVNFRKITSDTVKSKFLEEYERLMDDYETKRKQSEELYNKFVNYKQQNADIRLLKNEVNQLKMQLNSGISLITPCYITSSLYLQHHFSYLAAKNQLYKYQNQILECQSYYIEMMNKMNECENDLDKALGTYKSINTNHENKKPKIDRILNQPPPPSSSSSSSSPVKREIKDITPEDKMQSIYLYLY